jgi:hypothetical protein
MFNHGNVPSGLGHGPDRMNSYVTFPVLESDDDIPELESDDDIPDPGEEVKRNNPWPLDNNIRGTSNFSSTVDEKGSVEITVTYDSFSYKCCVCQYGIIGPIVSCNNSHALCSDCVMGIKKTGIHRCPLCRSKEWWRNLILEKALRAVIKACPFENNGCNNLSYPEDMKDHTNTCEYAKINCPWCSEKTTPFHLQTHTEFDCKSQFSGMSCPGDFSNNTNFINLHETGNVFLVSAVEKFLVLYVEKDETTCRLLCVQGANTEEPITSVVMTHYTSSKSLDGMELIETRTVMLPVHRPGHLIKENVLKYDIPLQEIGEYKNISITGFKDKYRTGERWMVQDKNNNWYRATIRRRKYNPDGVLVKFDGFPDDKHDEWINLQDHASKKIRPLDANGGRTTTEERRYVENMDGDQQMMRALERSMNDL